MRRFLHLLLCVCAASFAAQAAIPLRNETKGQTTCLNGDVGVRKIRVGLYLDAGCRGGGVLHWARLLKTSPDVDFRMVDGRDVRAGRLAELDVLVMPGGGGFERYRSWGEEGCA